MSQICPLKNLHSLISSDLLRYLKACQLGEKRQRKRTLLQELDTVSHMTLRDIQAQKMSIGYVLTSLDIHALSIIINSIKGVLKHLDDQTY